VVLGLQVRRSLAELEVEVQQRLVVQWPQDPVNQMVDLAEMVDVLRQM
jgi:hypothetical protein